MKLKRGQTMLSVRLAERSERVVIEAMTKAERLMTIYEISDTSGISSQAVFRVLSKWMADGLVKQTRPKGDGNGMRAYLYGLTAKGHSVDIRFENANPFAVAAGMVLPTMGWNGRVHRMLDDELEEMAA